MSGFISSQNGLSWNDGAAVPVDGGGHADRHGQHAPEVAPASARAASDALLDEGEPARGGAVLRRDGQHRAGERRPAQVRDGRADPVLTCVDTHDDPGAGVEGVAAGGPAVALVAAARRLSSSVTQPCSMSSSQTPCTVARESPVASMSADPVTSSASQRWSRTSRALASRRCRDDTGTRATT